MKCMILDDDDAEVMNEKRIFITNVLLRKKNRKIERVNLCLFDVFFLIFFPDSSIYELLFSL